MDEHLVLIHLMRGEFLLSERAQSLPMWQKQPRAANFNEANPK